jgi:hypothetical protein
MKIKPNNDFFKVNSPEYLPHIYMFDTLNTYNYQTVLAIQNLYENHTYNFITKMLVHCFETTSKLPYLLFKTLSTYKELLISEQRGDFESTT